MNIGMVIAYSLIVVSTYFMYRQMPKTPENIHNLPYSAGIILFIVGMLGYALSPIMFGFVDSNLFYIGLSGFAVLWSAGFIRDFYMENGKA